MFAAAVHHTFRMPLDGDDGQTHVPDSLNDIVPGAAYRSQTFSQTVHTLMVGGVDLRACTVQLIEEIGAVESAVIDVVLLVPAGPFMKISGFDVLCDRSAQMYVDQLKPFTYAQYGLFLFHKKAECLQLYDVQFCIDVM